MKIATWNVNSIKARLDHVLRWLKAVGPEIVLLQELKAVADDFPALELKSLGYAAAVVGQKTYNGVAILAKGRIAEVRTALPGEETDDQARYVEAVVAVDGARPVRAVSVYVPNGQAVGSDKFDYKLGFLARLEKHARTLLATEESVVLGGDYNVAPDPIDVFDPKALAGEVLFSRAERAALRRATNLGLTDALRALNPGAPNLFTWWDYRSNAWTRDAGLRIDHLLLSPQAADRLSEAGVDKTPRGWDKASDHAPVWCVLDA